MTNKLEREIVERCEFKANPSALPGVPNGPFNADALAGKQSTGLSVGPNGLFKGNTDCGFSAFWLKGSQLPAGTTGLNQAYSLTANLSYRGSVTAQSSGTYFAVESGTCNVYGATGTPPERILLGSANMASGGVTIEPAPPYGSIAIEFDDFILTTAGQGFFQSPYPFYLRMPINGLFDSIHQGGNIILKGSSELFFIV